jgi:hypothetical protein
VAPISGATLVYLSQQAIDNLLAVDW